MAHINPGLRIAHRGAGSLQIGVGPGGLVVEGLDEREEAFIAMLATGRGAPDPRQEAARAGIGEARAVELLAALEPVLFPTEAGEGSTGIRSERLRPEERRLAALHHRPADTLLGRREHAVVRINGLGRTGAALAQALVAAGVGTMLLQDDAVVRLADVGPGGYRMADIGMPRSAAVRRALLSLDPACQPHIVHAGSAASEDFHLLDLVVHCGHDTVDAATSAALMRRDQPHLLVLHREQDGTVGPLVLPGVGACAECVERHRADADPQWLGVCASLAGGEEPGEDAPSALSLAGAAARAALVFLDGVHAPAALSAVLTLRASDAAWSRTEYTAHPGCGCQFQRQALAMISNTASP
ncbi:ThiF family adenylyltransferase [Arthrobacter sp. 35W]|uniref:ThiF family adenylyltransferase n=1 Tax=Arthrobacter sp. 35W TaxID=1132441 RepID=UPI00042799C5|nr:ThiF family adenylyltransferase [Arthrobacter sp. 35W]